MTDDGIDPETPADSVVPAADVPSSRDVPFREAVWIWAQVAAYSFGGPAGQIGVMHKLLVAEKHWISERRFLHALNYTMLLPGPEAQQLATYVGWLLHRTKGGLVAGVLFILPGFVSILLLSILYVEFRGLTIVDAVFFGLQAAVLAVVVEALIRLGGRTLENGFMVAIAAGAFVAIFVFDVLFPIVIAAAALVGLLGYRLSPGAFTVVLGYGGDGASGDDANEAVISDAIGLADT